jgi:hypothetical protein
MLLDSTMQNLGDICSCTVGDNKVIYRNCDFLDGPEWRAEPLKAIVSQKGHRGRKELGAGRKAS